MMKKLFAIVLSVILISTSVAAFSFNFQPDYSAARFRINQNAFINSYQLFSSISLNTANAYVSDTAFDWFEMRGTVRGVRSDNSRVLITCNYRREEIFRALVPIDDNAFEFNESYLTRYTRQLTCTAKIMNGNRQIASTNPVDAQIIYPL